MAIPALWREVGEVLEIRDEVSLSSDWSSASRRASWVVAKAGISTASLGAMLDSKGGVCKSYCIGCCVLRHVRSRW